MQYNAMLPMFQSFEVVFNHLVTHLLILGWEDKWSALRQLMIGETIWVWVWETRKTGSLCRIITPLGVR